MVCSWFCVHSFLSRIMENRPRVGVVVLRAIPSCYDDQKDWTRCIMLLILSSRFVVVRGHSGSILRFSLCLATYSISIRPTTATGGTWRGGGVLMEKGRDMTERRNMKEADNCICK